MSTTKVILLGTGTPNAEPNKSGPSVAVLVDNFPLKNGIFESFFVHCLVHLNLVLNEVFIWFLNRWSLFPKICKK